MRIVLEKKSMPENIVLHGDRKDSQNKYNFILQSENVTNGNISKSVDYDNYPNVDGSYVSSSQYGAREMEWICLCYFDDRFQNGDMRKYLGDFFYGDERIKITVFTDYGEVYYNYMFSSDLPELKQLSTLNSVWEGRQKSICEFPLGINAEPDSIDLMSRHFMFTRYEGADAHKLLPDYFGYGSLKDVVVEQKTTGIGLMVEIVGTGTDLYIANILPSGKKLEFKVKGSVLSKTSTTKLYFPIPIATYTVDDVDIYSKIHPNSDRIYLESGTNKLTITDNSGGSGFQDIKVGEAGGRSKI